MSVEHEGDRIELELASLDLREVEDVVDHRQQRAGGVADREQVVALIGGQRGVERELGHADDAVHRRADLVAHVGEELALGAARVLGLALGARQRDFGAPSHGDLVAQLARARLEHALRARAPGFAAAARAAGTPATHEQPQPDADREPKGERLVEERLHVEGDRAVDAARSTPPTDATARNR